MRTQSRRIRWPFLTFLRSKQLDVSTSNLYNLAEDCLRFTMHFFHLIQQSAAHIYHSALPLSPKSSMLRSRRENTQIAGFYGRPDNWGSVVRTIRGTPTCMTTIGHSIAAHCDDGTVGIYDSVTGVLRLSLSPVHPIKAMKGSPDGSILFCIHRKSPTITLWDIQTGGLIHTFALMRPAVSAAISLKGRYFACGSSDGSVNFWEVANKTEGPAFSGGSSTDHLCWLAPEEQLMVAEATSVRIRDVITGRDLYNFRTDDPICDAVYSEKLDRLAIATTSGAAESIIIIIDTQTGTRSTSRMIPRRLSCLAFSRTTNEIVCGMKTQGLRLFNISTQRWRHFDHPATITSVSTLSNGTVVANSTSSGIQLLNLDEGYAPSKQLITPTLAVHCADEGKIIVLVPATRDRVIFLDPTTMLQLLTILVAGDNGALFLGTAVPCASLRHLMAVYCSEEGGRKNLQLWKFGHQVSPKWIAKTDELPSIGGVSPTGARLVTFHMNLRIHQSYICIWDVEYGTLLVKLLLDHPQLTRPLDITFDSEDRFYSRHNTYRIPYVFVTSSESGTPIFSIIRRGQLPPVSQPHKIQLFVDDGREWVTNGSQRICWIPPGYIGSFQPSYCWAGSTLVMAGQDGTLRKLTFREQ